MDKIFFEFRKKAESAGFPAGIADRSYKVLCAAEGIGLDTGDVISPDKFVMIDAKNRYGKEYILFAPFEENGTEASRNITLSALRLLSACVFEEAAPSRSVSGYFTDALEDIGGNSWKKLELSIPAPEKTEEYRLLTACCSKAGENEEAETDQLDQVREVAAELFPEAQGYVTSIFRAGGAGYVCTLIRTPLILDEDSTGAEECALSYIDTASAETMLDVRAAVSAGFRSVDRVGKMALQTVEMLRLGESFGICSRCLIYEKLGLERLISSIPEEDRLEYLRSVLGSNQWTDRSMQELLSTVSVFLQCNQNSSITAKRMYIHRNTVNYRIEKFGKLTGLDCASFTDGVRVRIALMIIRYMGQSDTADAPVD